MSGTTTVNASNTTLRFAAGANVVVNGDNDFIIAADGSSVTVNGSGNTLQAGANSTGSMTGTNNTLTEGGAGDAFSVHNTGGGTVTVNLNGSGDYVGLMGGSGYVVNNDQAGDVVNLASNTSATVNGSGGIIGIYGTGIVVAASNEVVQAVANTSFNLSGSGNNVTLSSGDALNITGGGNVVSGVGANTRVMASGTGGNFDTIGASGAADGGTTVTGQPTGIYLAADTQVNVGGSGNAIHLATGDSLGVFGGGNTVSTQARDLVYLSSTNGSFDTVYATGDQDGGKTANNQDSGIYLDVNTQANVIGSDNGIHVNDGDSLGAYGGGNTISGIGARNTIAVGTATGGSGAFNTLYATGAAFGGTAANGQGTGIFLQGNSQANVIGHRNGIAVNAGDSLGTFGGNNTISGIGATNTISVTSTSGGADGAFNTLYAIGAAFGGTAGNGQGTGIFVQANTQANVYGSGNGIAVKAGDSVGAYGGGNFITGIGLGDTIAVGSTAGWAATLDAYGDAFGGTAANGQGTGIFVQDDAQATIRGDGNGVSTGSRDTVTLTGDRNTLNAGTGTSGSVTGTSNTLNENGANAAFNVKNTGGGKVNVTLNGAGDYVGLQGGTDYAVTGLGGFIQGALGTGFSVAGYNNTVGLAFGDSAAVIGGGNMITAAAGSALLVQGAANTTNYVSAFNEGAGTTTAGGLQSGITVMGGGQLVMAGDGNQVAVQDGGVFNLNGSGNAVSTGSNVLVGITGNGNALVTGPGGSAWITGAYNNVGNSASTGVSWLSTSPASVDTSAGAIQSTYELVLGRFASAQEVADRRGDLARGATMDDIRRALGNYADSTIQALYQQVLGRAASAGEVAARERDLASWQTVGGLRWSNAHSDEAGGDLRYLISTETGRTADAGDLSYWADRLGSDLSLAGVQNALAYSDEAAARIGDIYQQVLGRAAGASEVADRQYELRSGATLDDLRWSLSQTGEAVAQVQTLYVQVLGRLASDSEVFDRQVDLASGQSLQGLRGSLAATDEAARDIQAIFARVMGRAADGNEVSAWQQALSSDQGWTMALVGPAVANVAINNFYQQVFGQDAPAAAVTSMKASLAQGTNLTTQFDYYRPILARSDYETAQINYFYSSTFGRYATGDAYSGEIGAIEYAVLNGQSLATLENNLTPEVARQVKALYRQDLGRDVEYAGLSLWEGQVASRGLGAVSWDIAHSQESANHLQALFQQNFGRAAIAAELSGFQDGEGTAVPVGTKFTVRTGMGQELATADARTILAEAGAYVGLSGGVAPTLTGPDGTVRYFHNGYEFMGFVLGLTNQAGQMDGAALRTYGLTVSWMDQVGQAEIEAAVKLQTMAQAHANSGDNLNAYLESIGAQLAVKMQQQAPDQRGPLSREVAVGQLVYTVTVNGDRNDTRGLAGYGWTVTDTDPERTALIAMAQSFADKASQDAGNQLLAFLDNAQARVDVAYAALPKGARTDRMLGVAQQFVDAAYGAAGRGNWNLVQTLETAADVSLQIAAQPEGSRHAVTERFVHEKVKHDITVDPNAADPFASFSDHSKGQDVIGAIVEGVVGVVINILAVIPATAPVFAPIAVAWDTAQAGKNFAEGNILGGFLSLASAAAVGLAGLDAISTGAEGANASSFAVQAGGLVNGFVEGTLGTTTATLGNLGSDIFAATALIGGATGIAQSAKTGDALGIAAGVLEVAAAVAGGLISTNSVDPALRTLVNNIRTGAGIASAAASAADAFANGNLAGGLATSLNALYSLIAIGIGESQKGSAAQGSTGAGSTATPAPTGGGDGATQEVLVPSTPTYGGLSDAGAGTGTAYASIANASLTMSDVGEFIFIRALPKVLGPVGAAITLYQFITDEGEPLPTYSVAGLPGAIAIRHDDTITIYEEGNHIPGEVLRRVGGFHIGSDGSLSDGFLPFTGSNVGRIDDATGVTLAPGAIDALRAQMTGLASAGTVVESSPSLNDDPYHPDAVQDRIKPPYKANPAHLPGSDYNPEKTPEPLDAAAVYKDSVRANTTTWYGKSSTGEYYQFYSDRAGSVHFSGIVPPSKVPSLIQRLLSPGAP